MNYIIWDRILTLKEESKFWFESCKDLAVLFANSISDLGNSTQFLFIQCFKVTSNGWNDICKYDIACRLQMEENTFIFSGW